MVSILFVCTGNTCRSVMADALTKSRYGDKANPRSAGLRPQRPEDAANAIETLKTHFRIEVSNHIPRNVRDFRFDDFDFVVAMDKHVAKQLKDIPLSKLLVWNVQDPYGDDLDEYRRCALEINQEVARLPISQP